MKRWAEWLVIAAPAVAVSGYYPTVSCVRHDAATNEYLVWLEQFVFREASAGGR